MDLQHEFDVPASIDEAWQLLRDVDRVASCFPGARITSISGDSFTGEVRIKFGPVSLTYIGSGQWVQRDERAHHAMITAGGKDKRGGGTATATIGVQLTAVPGGTSARVDTDLSITGRPAQFGRSIIIDVSNSLLDQFVVNLRRELDARPANEPTPPATDPQATSATAPQTAAADAPAEQAEQAEPSLNLARVLGPVLVRRLAPVAAGFLLGVLVTLLSRWRGRAG